MGLQLSKTLLLWWLLFWAQVIGAFIAWKGGFFAMIWRSDATMITSLVGVLLIVCSVNIGVDIARKSKDRLEYLWFAADSCMTLGMIGTALGFIIMMTGVFSNGLPTTPDGIQQALTRMSFGMGTALWTTACGLISSLLLKVQLVFLENMK